MTTLRRIVLAVISGTAVAMALLVGSASAQNSTAFEPEPPRDGILPTSRPCYQPMSGDTDDLIIRPPMPCPIPSPIKCDPRARKPICATPSPTYTIGPAPTYTIGPIEPTETIWPPNPPSAVPMED